MTANSKGFDCLEIKSSYDSDDDDILQDFYNPVLANSIEYRRLAGFFTSSALAVAARGIKGLLKNDGNMKLIAGAMLKKEDIEAIKKGIKEPEELINQAAIKDLNSIEEVFVKNHVMALGWLIAKQKLDVRIAIVEDENGVPLDAESTLLNGIFHQKVGIFTDRDGRNISFSGSVNETANAWLRNIEEFKVFRDWIDAEHEHYLSDEKKFEKYWNGNSQRVKTIEASTAIKEKLIQMAPNHIESLELDKWYTHKHEAKAKIVLFGHQKKAVESWINNGMRGIFEMATGTGKTFAALGCLLSVEKAYKKLVVIITCPYQHLVQQWKREIEKFGINSDIIIADSSNLTWKDDLADYLVDVSLGYKENIIILTTHRTFSSNTFMDLMKASKDNSNFNIFIIADEVHGLGAEKNRNSLINEYNFRLGLSATPKRWFDIIGTEAIYNYFNDVVFEFNLKDAINTINPITNRTYLAPYRYIPKFISFSDTELEDYRVQTEKIVRIYRKAKTEMERNEILERLYFKRANIIKNAVNKYQVLEDFLNKDPSRIKWSIIYCTPQQIDKVMDILNMCGIISHRFTMEENPTPDNKYSGLSERDFILKKFAEGKYQVLVAMKCLDEGVDVPPARIAFLMASSGNPREYIQRIGRVIRRYEGKSEATIYDVIVAPSLSFLPEQLKEIERTIFEKEIQRYEEIAQMAINNAEALSRVYEIKHNYMEA